mgnify:FL=1
MKPNQIQKEFLNLTAYVVGFIFIITTTSYLAIPLLWDEYGELNGVAAGIGAGAVYNIIIIYFYLGKKNNLENTKWVK